VEEGRRREGVLKGDGLPASLLGKKTLFGLIRGVKGGAFFGMSEVCNSCARRKGSHVASEEKGGAYEGRLVRVVDPSTKKKDSELFLREDQDVIGKN